MRALYAFLMALTIMGCGKQASSPVSPADPNLKEELRFTADNQCGFSTIAMLRSGTTLKVFGDDSVCPVQMTDPVNSCSGPVLATLDINAQTSFTDRCGNKIVISVAPASNDLIVKLY